jgi:hypothetical protein
LTSIALESRPIRAERVLAQPSAETLILLNPESGQYYTLDEVGARIWDLCDGSRQVTDLVSLIHAEFDAPVAAIQADVVELLDDLCRDKLVAVR